MRWLGWAVAAILGALLILPKTTKPPAPDKLTDIATLPGAAPVADPAILRPDPDKIRAIATLPQPAALPRDDVPNLIPRAPLQTLYLTGTRVNLRAGPGTAHNVVWHAPNGTAFFLQDQQNGWSRITGKSPNGPVSGWMSSRYLAAKRPTAAPPKPKTRRAVATPTSRELTAALKAIIDQSIRAYPGACPCPYFRDRAGRRCGKRSAWNRRGGYAPLCYDSDVTEARLHSYLARRRN